MIDKSLEIVDNAIVGKTTIEILVIILVVAILFFIGYCLMQIKPALEKKAEAELKREQSNIALTDAVLSMIKAIEKLDYTITQSQHWKR